MTDRAGAIAPALIPMKEEVKTPIIIIVVVLIVLIVGYFGFKSISSAGNLDQGQIKYTPGVPPWQEKDPSKRGPGGGGFGAPANAQSGGPPGMTPPSSGAPGK